jgi:hypothetical protein
MGSQRMLELAVQTANKYRPRPVTPILSIKQKVRTAIALIFVLVFSLAGLGQGNGSIPYKSQEVSESDGLPVLIKHLPDWERVRDQTDFAVNSEQLKAFLGDRRIFDQVEFIGGTEAAAAQYPSGKLLLVEYASPQASIDADNRIKAALAASVDTSTIYRRIGNYNAFVFDSPDAAAANALLDQVKYEKIVRWLGRDPYQISPERAFVIGTSDLFVSTVLIVVMGIGLSLFAGVIGGYFFFLFRDNRRSRTAAFSDAGGMTRLNLDGFTADIIPKGYLED